jgi:hypothetical protein
VAPPKSPAVALIFETMRAAEEGKAPKPAAKPEAPAGELAAAEEAMAAVRAGDAEGFASALRSFVRICTAGSSGGYEATEGE